MAFAPAAAAPGLNIKELLSNLDVDGDGDIDEDDKAIAEALKSMDMDGDGTISIRELIKIGEVRVRNEKRIKNLTYAVFLLCGLFVVFCAVMMALVVAANEATKDTRPSGDGTMKTVYGKVVSTESKTYPLILADLPRYPFEVIESLNTLRVRREGTTHIYYYTVTGYTWFSKYSMQLHTARNDIISINGVGEGSPVAVTVMSGETGGASFSIVIAPEKTAAARRRLMQASSDSDAIDQDGTDVTASVNGIPDMSDEPAGKQTDPDENVSDDEVEVEKWDAKFRMDMVEAYGTCILSAPDIEEDTEATMTYETEVIDFFSKACDVAEGVTAAVGMKQTKAKIDAALASKSDGKRLFTKMQVDFVECCASIMPWPRPDDNVVPISKWPPAEPEDFDDTDNDVSNDPTDIASLYNKCYTEYNDAAKKANKPQFEVTNTIQIGGCMNEDAKNYNATATFDDDSCEMPKVGCKVKKALNYDATLDVKDKNDPAKCIMLISGCMDAAATNFVPKAIKDPLLKINDKVVDWKYEKNGDAGIIMEPTMDAVQAQYDTRMITDSLNKSNTKPQVGSCTYKVKIYGCWDKMSTNYNKLATDMDYEMCEPFVDTVDGCMFESAANYNASANADSGLCTCAGNLTATYDWDNEAAAAADSEEPKNAAEYNAQIYVLPKFSCVNTTAPGSAPAEQTATRHLLATELLKDSEECTKSADCHSDFCYKPDGPDAKGECRYLSAAGKLNTKRVGSACEQNSECQSSICENKICKSAVSQKDKDWYISNCKTKTKRYSSKTNAKNCRLITRAMRGTKRMKMKNLELAPSGCRSTVYFNIDLSRVLTETDYNTLMAKVTSAAQSMIEDPTRDTMVGVVGFRGPVDEADFKLLANVDEAKLSAQMKTQISHLLTGAPSYNADGSIKKFHKKFSKMNKHMVVATGNFSEFKEQMDLYSWNDNVENNPLNSDVSAGLVGAYQGIIEVQQQLPHMRKAYIITLQAQNMVNLKRMEAAAFHIKRKRIWFIHYNMNPTKVESFPYTNDLSSKNSKIPEGKRQFNVHWSGDEVQQMKGIMETNLDTLLKNQKEHFAVSTSKGSGSTRFCHQVRDAPKEPYLFVKGSIHG